MELRLVCWYETVDQGYYPSVLYPLPTTRGERIFFLLHAWLESLCVLVPRLAMSQVDGMICENTKEALKKITLKLSSSAVRRDTTHHSPFNPLLLILRLQVVQ